MAKELATGILEPAHAPYAAQSLSESRCRCWSGMATSTSKRTSVTSTTPESTGTASGSKPTPPPPPQMSLNAVQAPRRAHRHRAVQESESDDASDQEDADGAAPNVRPPNACKVARYKESATGVNIESWMYQMENYMELNGIPRVFWVKTCIANFHSTF